jgi:hypothetical protein
MLMGRIREDQVVISLMEQGGTAYQTLFTEYRPKWPINRPAIAVYRWGRLVNRFGDE